MVTASLLKMVSKAVPSILVLSIIWVAMLALPVVAEETPLVKPIEIGVVYNKKLSIKVTPVMSNGDL